MRRFILHRRQDATGISGTGVVAEGVIFGDGTCALRWRTSSKSTAFYDDFETLMRIHGHAGQTVPLWLDEYEHAPVPCTRYSAEYPGGVPGMAAPACWLTKGWAAPNGAADRNGAALFVGQRIRLHRLFGEIGQEGEIANICVEPGGRAAAGVIGCDCGLTGYAIHELDAIETMEECRARSGGRPPEYGWTPAMTIA